MEVVSGRLQICCWMGSRACVRGGCKTQHGGSSWRLKSFSATVIYSTSSNKVFALAKSLPFKCDIPCSFCAGMCPGRR